VYVHLDRSLARLFAHPLLWLIVLASVWATRRRRPAALPTSETADLRRPKTGAGLVIVFGALLFVGAAFAYVAVGLAPSTAGWSTRHALLLGLPMAIIIVGFLRLIPARFRVAAPYVGASLVLAFTLSTIRFYAAWQARWAKDRAILAGLASATWLKPYSVYWIDDQFPLGGEPGRGTYEWASMFRTVWGGQSRIGLELQRASETDSTYRLGATSRYYIADYNLGNYDPKGPQVLLTIKPIMYRYSDSQLTRRYLFFRFRDAIRHDDEFGIFLRSLARIEARPIPETGDCALRPFAIVTLVCVPQTLPSTPLPPP
jgi:hypothetical protein